LLSIILGLAITQILKGFRGIVLARSRVRMYWAGPGLGGAAADHRSAKLARGIQAARDRQLDFSSNFRGAGTQGCIGRHATPRPH